MVPIRGYDSKKYNFVLAAVALIVVINQLLVVVTAFYLPSEGYIPSEIRRTDSEEDDMDQTASAPYQQGGNNAGGSDGYEENEPDGPYGETPREEEGQADMEKFFDDHLGASERDGMDKENLPTNLKPLVYVGDSLPTIGPKGLIEAQGSGSSGQANDQDDYDRPYVRSDTQANYLDPLNDATDVDTKYIKLPNKKLLVTHQITNDLLNDSEQKQATNALDRDTEAETTSSSSRGTPQTSGSGLEANGSEIVALEDEEADKIYVTNMTNRPFKIDALGGYDPEEDFQAASRDIEEPGKQQPLGKRKRNEENEQEQEQEPRTKDITFNDPESDTLFNDASETDEVTFAHDDPYQTDLEAEIQGQPMTRRHSPARKRKEPLDDLDYDSPETNLQPRRRSNADDDETSWVNDGVDDMEVPSQAYQDSVLDKAAKQQALAEEQRNAIADNGTPQQEDANTEESDNVRMPNADYLKDDLKEMGDKAK